jgi:hypothetical protein
VEATCDGWANDSTAYPQCLNDCDQINRESTEGGKTADLACADRCYQDEEDGAIECADLSGCISGDCAAWWAPG